MKNVSPTQLTDKKLEHLAARYYAGEKVTNLIDEFQLNIAPSGLVRLLPTRILDDLMCPYCAQPMHQRPPSRTALQSGYGIPTPFCEECGHKNRDSCRCKNCRISLEEKRISQQRKLEKRLLKLKHPGRAFPISPSECSFQQAFYVVGLCRAGQCEEGGLILSIQSQGVPLAPTRSFAVEIVQSLHNQQLIDISLSSPLDCFELEESGALEPIWDQIRFDLHLGAREQESLVVFNYLESIVHCRGKWPEPWRAELLGVWQELAMHECLRYLEVILSDHGFRFRAGAKTQQVLSDALRNYSISQVYNFIWTAVRDAAGYFLREGTSRQQAANTVAGSIQRKAERALSEEWNIKSFRRDYRCSESILAAHFAYVSTSLGERYLTAAPSEAALMA